MFHVCDQQKNETNYSAVRANTCILKCEHSLVNKTGIRPPFMIFYTTIM